MQKESLYKEEILDHYKNPRNYHHLEDATGTTEMANLSCGDELHLEVFVKDGVLENVGFLGTGCAISIAAASMLYEKVKGKPVKEISKMKSDDVLKMVGMTKESGRVKCALLGWEALKKVFDECYECKKK